MVYRRRRRTSYRRKKRYFKRKYYGPKYRIPRRRLTDGTVYSFKRTHQATSLASVATTPFAAYGNIVFALSSLPQYGEFTSLFDAYKITGVKLRFIPRVTENSTATANFGTFMYTPDYDDTTTPTSQDELLQRQSTRIRYSVSKPFNLFIKPRPGINVPGGFGQAPYSMWQDTSSPSIFYYGFKWAWVNTTVVQTMDLYVTYYLKFKNVK